MKRMLWFLCCLGLCASPVLAGCSDDTSEPNAQGSQVVDPEGGGSGGGGGGEVDPPSGECLTQDQAQAAQCQGRECGNFSVDDGCGATLTGTCGACEQGQCLNGVCTDPTTCLTAAQAKAAYCGDDPELTECGEVQVAGGCEGVTSVNCGGCGAKQVCEEGVCRAQSSACVTAEAARQTYCGNDVGQAGCGSMPVENGCDGLASIDCGDCGEDETCTNHYCQEKECLPKSRNELYSTECRPKNRVCGFYKVENGCGGYIEDLNCGTCGESETCTQNDAGSSCVYEGGQTECEIDDETFCTNNFSECGTAVGKDKCGAPKSVNCGSCETDQICSGDYKNGHPTQTCNTAPTPIALNACEATSGDTSDMSVATSVMSLGTFSTLADAWRHRGPEIVYSYTATKTGKVKVTVTPYNAPDYDVSLYVLYGLDQRAPVEDGEGKAEIDAGDTGVPETLIFNAYEGVTYYIVVDNNKYTGKYTKGAFRLLVNDGTCPVENGGVVISGVYVGGGSTGEVFYQDFIELHNRGNEAVDISGWSVFTGTPETRAGWWAALKTVPEGSSIPAGGYYLIGERSPDDEDKPNDPKNISTPDLNVGKDKFRLTAGYDGSKKILIAKKNVVLASLNDAIDADGKKGIMCPSEDMGILFIYGDQGRCGFQWPALLANEWLYSTDGCQDMTRQTAVETTKPRNSETTEKVCTQDPNFQ